MPSAADTGGRYPVPYTFAANVAAAALEPGTAPPGSNDWSCRPSEAHPQPVILVHGLFANMTDNWQTMSPLLANNGYCVFAFTYGTTPGAAFPFDQIGGLEQMDKSAVELSAFVDEVLDRTGSRQVDIVGHSEGATMPDYYIEYLGGAAKVARYVGVSGVKHGTTLHGLNTFVDRVRHALSRNADRHDRVVRIVPTIPCRIRLRRHDRSPGARTRCHLHEYRDPLRRTRQSVHEQFPRGTERHEHHRARPVPARLQRSPFDHLQSDHRPVHLERARPRARTATTVHAGTPRSVTGRPRPPLRWRTGPRTSATH